MNNKKKGFGAVFKRELKRINSRPLYLMMILVIPVCCYLFFTTLMPQGLPNKLPIGIVDADNSDVSRMLIRNLDATAQNEVFKKYANHSEARADMQKGVIFGFVDIPKDFEVLATSGKQPEVNFYYNQSLIIAGSLTMKNITTMLTTVSGAVTLKMDQARGKTDREIMAKLQPIVPDVHMIGNPQINYPVYLITMIVPGLLEMIIVLITVFVIGIEIKHQTSREWLSVANDNLLMALLGKLLPYTIAYSIMGFLYLTILFKFMHFPLNAPIIWMVLDMVLLVIASQAMGIVIISILPALRDALSLASVFSVLGLSFSGFSFPIEGMLSWLQGLSAIFPLRYYFKIYTNFALNGLGFAYEWISFVAMLLFLLAPFLLCARLKNACILQHYSE